MDSHDSEAILELLDDEDVEEFRELSAYAPDVAGGLMMTEFAAYPRTATVREVEILDTHQLADRLQSSA